MHNLPNSASIKFDFYQLHKSFGLSILALTTLRLVWRLTHKIPPLPAAMPAWQKAAARGTHWAFYALLFVTPLVGWAIVSVSPKDIPTFWFGLFSVPHLPFFDGVIDRSAVEDVFEEGHEFLAFAILGLLALHVGAALKHGFINRDGVLRSMAPKFGALIGMLVIFGGLGVAVSHYLTAAPSATAQTAPVEPALIIEAEPEPVVLTEAPENVVGAEISPTEPSPAQIETTPAAPEKLMRWSVDYDASWLRFIGEENGRTFEGGFSDFSAEILFDPDRLSESKIRVKVQTATASTGDALRDATIPGKEWFDTKQYPSATFVSTDIRALGGNAYEANGALTIKDVSHNIVLPFTLNIEGEQAIATGTVDLLRTDFGLGVAESWLGDEGIALNVRVEFDIKAAREP